MKTTLLIFSTLLAAGCNVTPDDPLQVAWALHLPHIKDEPNYQVLLKDKSENFCMFSILDSALKLDTVISISHPGELLSDIDCHWNGNTFALDSSDSTYIKAAITGRSDDLFTVTLDTKLVDVFSDDYLTVSQSFLVSTNPNYYKVPQYTVRDESTNTL